MARRIADLIPNSALVELPTAGHSILDTREQAALQICRAVSTGAAGQLSSRSAELDALPANLTMRLLVRGGIAIAARAEAVVPDAVPRVVRQATSFMKPIAV